ncbi:hypothetical protein D5S17_34260 [Pseudonocardiaceae bacterium YIM PH 21723]|nr:hypothetical protein D5S17_34260 [Pseudonocardiaceae bacterium YIM PH 21723]
MAAMFTRSVVVIAGWLAAATASVAAGLLAVGALGAGIVPSSPDPLTDEQVKAQLAAARPLPGRPSGASAPGGQGHVLNTPGGTIVASCSGDQVSIASVSPAQGFKVDEAEGNKVEFDGDDVEIKATVRCVNGVPQVAVEQDR